MKNENLLLITKSEKVFLSIVFFVFMIIGFVLLPDFTVTWDEPRLFSYADQSSGAYTFLGDENYEAYFGTDDLKYYGPAYLLLVNLIVKTVKFVFHTSQTISVWHYVNYTVFLFGGIFLYMLSRYWLSIQSSIFVFLLYLTQPIFFGHSFINLKDIPFMVSFVATILAGVGAFNKLYYQGKIHHQTGEKKSPSIEYEFVNIFNTLKMLLREPLIWLFIFILGFTAAIRILGFWAGVIIFIYSYMVLGYRKNSIFAFIIYCALAFLVSCFFWPFLWEYPIINFLSSLWVMSNFKWQGLVLYNGNYYHSNAIPWSYFPLLLLYQLTEPFIILSLTAIFSFFSSDQRKDSKNKSFFLLFFFWFFLFFIGAILGKVSLYDNFRQLLFIFPPLFIFAGFGYEFIAMRLKKKYQAVLVFTLLLPGIFGIYSFHPYEYIYYNNFMGGTENIYSRFETDYWGLSLYDATEYVNRNAPLGSDVFVYGAPDVVKMYARSDLYLRYIEKPCPTSSKNSYAILLLRENAMETICQDAPIEYSVHKNNIPLAIVRKITSGND